MKPLARILLAAALASCAGPPPQPEDERWSLTVSVDDQTIVMGYDVPPEQVAAERARAAQFFAHAATKGGGGALGFAALLRAGEERVGDVALRTDAAGVEHLMSHAQVLVAAVPRDEGASALCAAIGWCDELPGTCLCLCLCGCSCVYWE